MQRKQYFKQERIAASYSKLEKIILFIVGVCVVFLGLGFFYPDPEIFEQASLSKSLIIWVVRITIPMLGLLGLLFYHFIKIKRIGMGEGLLVLGTLCILGLLLYPFANFIFFKFHSSRSIDLYHPYLQLTPNPIKASDSPIDSHYTILCLGGSTTEFKDRNGKGWPKYLEEYLQPAAGDNHIRVFNQGRQWYTTQHSLINYATNLQHHPFDLIIIMHTINDLLHNADFSYFCNRPFRQDYGHFMGPVWGLINRKGVGNYILGKLRHFWYYPKRESITTSHFPGLVPFARNIETIIKLAKLNRTKVVLMTQPSLYQANMSPEALSRLYMLHHEAIGYDKKWNYSTAFNGFEAYKRSIKSISEQFGTYYIDLEGEIPKTLEFFRDDVHYTDSAYKLVAEVVSQNLVDKGIFAPKF